MDTNVVTPTGVRKEVSKSAVTFSGISTVEFQKKGTKRVELRQKVTTKSFYPTIKLESNMQNSLFTPEESGIEASEFTSEENRVAWVDVKETMSEAEIVARIAADSTNGSTIYRVLKSSPIIDENQQYAINQGLRDKDHYANAQVVRFPENNKTVAEGTANKIIKDANGNPQYRRTFYWKTPHADVDARDVNDVYLSPEIALELQGASALLGQTIG